MKPCGLVHGWGTKKDNLPRKGLQRTNLDFYGIYCIIIIIEFFMHTLKIMKC